MAIDTLWSDEFESDFSASEKNDLDVWGMFWRRKWVIISCLVLGLLGGFLYFFSATPLYKSSANVLIERKQPPIQEMAGTRFNVYQNIADIAKHPIVIASPAIAVSAYEDHQLSQCPSLQGAENPVAKIMESLNVEIFQEGIGVYEVSYVGTNRQDTGKIVSAVVESYRNSLQTSHRTVGEETREYITQTKEELGRELRTLDKNYAEFKEDAPLLWRDGLGINLHQERQMQIENNRSLVLLEISKLESQLNTIKDAIENKQSLAGIISMAMTSLGDQGARPVSLFERQQYQYQVQTQYQSRLSDQSLLARTQQLLMPLKLSEEELIARYGKDHPRVKAIRRSIVETQKSLDEMEQVDQKHRDVFAEMMDSFDHESETRRWHRSILKSYVQSLKQQLSQARSQLTTLDEQYRTETEKAKMLTRAQATDEQFRNEIERKKELYDQIVKNLEKIDLNDDGTGYRFQVIAAAGPGWKVAPNPIKTFGIAAVLGTLLGGGLAFLLEQKDQSFHSPVEIAQFLQAPVIGNIPVIEYRQDEIPEQSKDLDGVLCTVHEPRSPESEAYRTIRTAIFFDARGSDHHVLQVTSPRPGDGKSTLAANLAVTVAQGGKKTLLIDADFRRPTAHRVFGFTQKKGMAALLTGKAEPHEVLHSIECVPNLTVAPCGLRPTNPSELLSSKQFAATIAYLKEQFDFVIIDTPPLLAVSDPRAVAASVDGVVLTMRIDKEARPVAKRATEILREAGASVVGIVVNGVNDKTEHYNHGAQAYGYNANKYGYGHAYGYGDDYEEEDADTNAEDNLIGLVEE